MTLENIVDNSITQTELIGTIAQQFLPSLAKGVFVFVGFLFLYLITKGVLIKLLRRGHFDEALIRILIQNIYKVVVLAFGFVMALSQIGINIVAALTGFGIAGIAVGFAAKDVLSNIIAGFMIFWDKPFRVGQWITVAGQYGKVNDITLRTTRIRTRNNTYVVIPNQKVIDEVLVNHSRRGITRLDAHVSIAYKESIDSARNVLLTAISSIDKIIKDPEPRVVVEKLDNSSVNLVVQGWIENAEDETGVLYEMIEASKKALDKAEIQIPFPHMQLFVDKVSNDVITKLNKK